MTNAPIASDPPVTIVAAPKPTIAAWLLAQATRYVVPFVLAALVGFAAKHNTKIDPVSAYVFVSGAVGAGIKALFAWLESSYPWARRILLAKKPV